MIMNSDQLNELNIIIQSTAERIDNSEIEELLKALLGINLESFTHYLCDNYNMASYSKEELIECLYEWNSNTMYHYLTGKIQFIQ